MFYPNHRTFLHPTLSSQLIAGRSLIAISIASVMTIWSLYLSSIGLSDSQIGFFSGFLIIVSLLTSYLSPPALNNLGEYKMLIFSITLVALSYLLIYYVDKILVFIIITFILIIGRTLYLECFDILFKNNIPKKKFGKLEGFLFSFMDIAWIVGPLIAGIISSSNKLNNIFLFAGVVTILTLIYFLFMGKIITNKHITNKKTKFKVKNNLVEFFKNKNLVKTYVVTLGINFWFAFIYIYMPLFITRQVNDDIYIGLYIALINFLLMLISLKLGAILSKFSTKALFSYGYISLAIISFLLFFIENIYTLMFLTSIGSIWLGVLEPLRSFAFFKQVTPKEEEKFFPIFITNIEFGGVIAKILIATILLILPSYYSFILVGIFMFTMFVFSTKLPNILSTPTSSL